MDFNGFIDFILSRRFDRNYSTLYTLRKFLADTVNTESLDSYNIDTANLRNYSYKSIILNYLIPLIFNLQQDILNKILKLEFK